MAYQNHADCSISIASRSAFLNVYHQTAIKSYSEVHYSNAVNECNVIWLKAILSSSEDLSFK